MILHLLGAFDDVLVQPFMPHRAIATLDTGVLLGLAWLDVRGCNLLPFGPFHQLSADVFRAVIDPYGAGIPAIR